MNDSYDSPWKDALLDLFQPFLALLFPAVEAAIDWSCEVVALDKDLRQLAPEAELGPREADMLFQAKLLDGQPGWFYLHVEVQSQHVKDFARRMFVYHYRIFDKFGDRVFSLGVLGDTSRSWRPDRFRSEWFGCRLDFHFPIVKLADFRPRLTELEGDPNPFAPFVAAHLWTQATRKRPKKRVEVKARLFRDLLRRGWDRPRVLKMLRLIDGLLKLEPPYSLQFLEKLAQYETEDQMPYISPIEQIGFDKGLEEARLEGFRESRQTIVAILQSRFEAVPATLEAMLAGVSDAGRLRELAVRAANAASVDAFLSAFEQP